MAVEHIDGAVIRGLNRIASRPRVATPVRDLPAGVCVTLPTKIAGIDNLPETMTTLKEFVSAKWLRSSSRRPSRESPARKTRRIREASTPTDSELFSRRWWLSAASHPGENRVMVLATGQPLTAAVLKKVKEKEAGDSIDGEFDQPYLKAVFLEDGSLETLIGVGRGTSFTQGGSPEEGKAPSPMVAFAEP
jgi:hypothetical protein